MAFNFPPRKIFDEEEKSVSNQDYNSLAGAITSTAYQYVRTLLAP